MKNFLIGTAVIAAIIASIFLLVSVSWSNPVVTANDQLKKAVAQRDATIAQLQAAAQQYTAVPDPLAEAAKAGFTELPGWQFQKILERGGNGSIFLQLSAATDQYLATLSTAGPLGYSWQSTTDDAFKAAADRRGRKSK